MWYQTKESIVSSLGAAAQASSADPETCAAWDKAQQDDVDAMDADPQARAALATIRAKTLTTVIYI